VPREPVIQQRGNDVRARVIYKELAAVDFKDAARLHGRARIAELPLELGQIFMNLLE